MRAFGPLRADAQAPLMPTTDDALLVEVLREQLRQAQEREVRLLTMLENEQQSRRELEQKLLPALSRPVQASNGRLWILLVLLALVLVGLVASLTHPELVGRLIGR